MRKIRRMFMASFVSLCVVPVFARDAAAPPQDPVREIAPLRADQPDLARRRALRRTPIVEAVEKVRDSVVNISSTSIVRVDPFGGFFGVPPEFEGLFGGRPQRVQSAGSGFVLHPAGYIVTNAHVVAGTKDLKVTFADDRTSYDAQTIAVDEEHDLAILKVDADKPIRAAVLGTSSDLMIGETVIAIGNPFGFEHTVTSGVLSHKGRKLNLPNDPGRERELLQTDAAINPGNSGGPLLNILGEVIGVNTAIRGDAQNIGFAIPVDELRRFLPSILDIERINRVRLGVHFEGVGPARIAKIDPGSPAARAGLRVGDVIVSVDNRAIAQDIDFFVEMMSKKAGDTVSLVVQRGQQRHRFTVELVGKPSGGEQAWSKLGLRLRPLADDQTRRNRLVADTGMLVYEVHEAGTAYAAGIEPGDILVRIDDKPITDLLALAEVLDQKESGDSVRIEYVRVQTRRVGRFLQEMAVPMSANVKVR